MAPVVGIDASRFSVKQRTGTETYSYELLNALSEFEVDDLEFRLYVNRSSFGDRATLAKLGAVREIPFPRLWTHARLSFEIALNRPELLFVPSHVVPIVHPQSVVTIHDLGYLVEPESHPSRQLKMLDATTRWNAKVAHRIIAISETTRRDLIDRYNVADDKIRVVYHGVATRFQPVSDDEHTRVRASLRLPKRFVLAVGTVQPRKNLVVLAKAVASLKSDYPELGLVLAGRMGWMSDDVLTDVSAIVSGRDLRILDFVRESDLPSLYGAADAVAMVSRYEGFGLPVLEAMACGAQVIVSDTPALIEIARGAAPVVGVDDVEGLAATIRATLDGRLDTRPQGTTRAAEFTWRRCAEQTVDVLRESMGR